MSVITISRQYGSGGDEIAVRVCELTGFRYFDKDLIARVVADLGLAQQDIVDYSEDSYQVRSFVERVMGTSRVVSETHILKGETAAGGADLEIKRLDESDTIALVRSAVQAAYKLGDVVIVGRGGQAILQPSLGVLHVRIEAPLSVRIQRVQDEAHITRSLAQEIIAARDAAAADYIKRFYYLNWADPTLYHLVLNTGRWGVEQTALIIEHALERMAEPEALAAA
jgi:cytidylate kinase